MQRVTGQCNEGRGRTKAVNEIEARMTETGFWRSLPAKLAGGVVTIAACFALFANAEIQANEGVSATESTSVALVDDDDDIIDEIIDIIEEIIGGGGGGG